MHHEHFRTHLIFFFCDPQKSSHSAISKQKYAAPLVSQISICSNTLRYHCPYQSYCFYFNFPTFKPENQSNLWLHDNSKIFLDAIQVTPDIRGSMENYSGRVIYRKPYRLWKQKNNQNNLGIFNLLSNLL